MGPGQQVFAGNGLEAVLSSVGLPMMTASDSGSESKPAGWRAAAPAVSPLPSILSARFQASGTGLTALAPNAVAAVSDPGDSAENLEPQPLSAHPPAHLSKGTLLRTVQLLTEPIVATVCRSSEEALPSGAGHVGFSPSKRSRPMRWASWESNGPIVHSRATDPEDLSPGRREQLGQGHDGADGELVADRT